MFPQIGGPYRRLLTGALLIGSTLAGGTLSLLGGALAGPAAAQVESEDLHEPVRLAMDVFATTAEVELREMPGEAARRAAEAALMEILAVERLTAPDGEEAGGVGQLNLAAGQGPRQIDPRVAEVLVRSLQFCIWSSGAYGPLGGELDRLWNDRPKRSKPPPVAQLQIALGSAECHRLRLVGAKGQPPTGELLTGSRIALRGFARGYAVDRAISVLQDLGVDNAWVEIGAVRRAIGSGPDGRGWPVTLPQMPGGEEPLDELWLRDQSLVVLSIDPPAGETFRPIIDQRTGIPARGVISVVTVTEQAVDAQPLASALFILGHREGLMRLGSLEPRPSVYWLLGEGLSGRPLESTYHWSDLERIRRRQ